MSRCTALNARYSEISARLLIKPDTSEQLVELQVFVDEVPTELTDMQNKFHGPGGSALPHSCCLRLTASALPAPQLSPHSRVVSPPPQPWVGAPNLYVIWCRCLGGTGGCRQLLLFLYAEGLVREGVVSSPAAASTVALMASLNTMVWNT
jgi:hypothetical protein